MWWQILLNDEWRMGGKCRWTDFATHPGNQCRHQTEDNTAPNNGLEPPVIAQHAFLFRYFWFWLRGGQEGRMCRLTDDITSPFPPLNYLLSGGYQSPPGLARDKGWISSFVYCPHFSEFSYLACVKLWILSTHVAQPYDLSEEERNWLPAAQEKSFECRSQVWTIDSDCFNLLRLTSWPWRSTADWTNLPGLLRFTS